jgi:hypothetical protein
VRCTITTAALFVGCLSVFAGRLSADETAVDKLPEPAIRFAKDASLRVTELEREWQTLSETLRKSRPELVPRSGRHTDALLQEESKNVLSAAKKLLEVESRMPSTIEQFRDALKKSAAHYQEVAALYKTHAESAKTPEVKDDYRELAKVYESKAHAAIERAEKLPVAVLTRAAREVVSEGNLFIERLLESLAVGPVTDSERDLFLSRLRKHGERCHSLSDELLKAVELLVKGSSPSEVTRFPLGGESYSTASTALQENAPEPSQRDVYSIVGITWSSRVKVRGVDCRQRIQLRPDGTCTQAIYLARPEGFGPLLSRRSYTYKLNPAGHFAVFSGGKLLETGKVTVDGEESWIYDIYENVSDPSLSAERITFARDSTG